MCYGMHSEWENSSGNCTWNKGLPYPCSDNFIDEETQDDERYHYQKDNNIRCAGNFDEDTHDRPK